MTTAEAVATTQAERPMLVYVYDDSLEDARDAITTDKAFADDKVAIGARYFDCLRIDADSAKDDRALARVRRLPALVFLRPNFKAVKILSGRLSANKVFGTMCATLRHDYTNSVTTVVKKQKAIMKGRVKVDRDRIKLAALEGQIADEKSRVKRARLIKQRDALQKQVDAADQKFGELEAVLYKLEAKETS